MYEDLLDEPENLVTLVLLQRGASPIVFIDSGESALSRVCAYENLSILFVLIGERACPKHSIASSAHKPRMEPGFHQRGLILSRVVVEVGSGPE